MHYHSFPPLSPVPKVIKKTALPLSDFNCLIQLSTGFIFVCVSLGEEILALSLFLADAAGGVAGQGS